MKTVIPLCSALLLASCAAEEPMFGARGEITDVAGDYAGLPASGPGLSVAAAEPVDQQFQAVRLRRGEHDLVTVEAPREWVVRTLWTGTGGRGEGRVYHFGLVQWETGDHRRVEVAVRYLGEKDIFIRNENTWEMLVPGSRFRVGPAGVLALVAQR